MLWRSADQIHFVRWDLFDEISVLGDGLFLRAGLIGFPLPFRAFTTPSEREDFKSILREHLPLGLVEHELLQPTLA